MMLPIPPIPAAVPLGKLQIVCNNTQMPNSDSVNNWGTTYSRFSGRVLCTLGNAACSDFRFGFMGYTVRSGGGASETVLGNDYDAYAALELTSPVIDQLSYNSYGKGAGANIPNGSALVLADSPICLNMAAGTQFYTRTEVAASSLSDTVPTGDTSITTESGYASGSNISQIDATGSFTDPGGASGSAGGGFAQILLGVSATPLPACIILGDSLALGTNDSADSFGSLGAISKGLNAVSPQPVPWHRQAAGGTRASYASIDKSFRRQAVWKYASHLICNLGTNDINAGDSASTVETNLQAIWRSAKRIIGPYGKPLKVWQVLIWPRTTSSDSWATPGNQTAVAGFTVGGVRDVVNAWIKTQVGQGLLDGYIDMNQYIEDQSNLSKWVTNGAGNYYTSDGTHGVAASYTAAAVAMTNIAKYFSV